MRAVILAAGLGRRLGAQTPKCLLEFGGKTLLRRHLEILTGCGLDEIVIAVGHQAQAIKAALSPMGDVVRVRLVHNPDYAQGSVVTLWSLREELCAGGDVLLMDADVLYDARMIVRLQQTRHRNCFLLDRDFESGAEPVKLCVRGGRLIELRKQVDVACDYAGESVGFFRLSSGMARRLAGTAVHYVETGRRNQPFEEALRDLLLAAPAEFGFEDVTGLPWIEIDFPEDVERARREILPCLETGAIVAR